MAKVDLYNVSHQKVGDIELADAVFCIAEINKDLFYEVVKAQLASRRAGTHAAKGRAAVRGSKRKLYRQNGTGNARHGSLRAPTYVHGGVAHPPIPRSYEFRPPRKMRQAALRHALSLYLKEGRLAVVDKWAVEAIKTKTVATALKAFDGAEKKKDGSFLVVDVLGVPPAAEKPGAKPALTNGERLRLSVQNLERATFLPPEGVNLYDILRHDRLILTQDAARALEARLSA